MRLPGGAAIEGETATDVVAAGAAVRAATLAASASAFICAARPLGIGAWDFEEALNDCTAAAFDVGCTEEAFEGGGAVAAVSSSQRLQVRRVA